VLTGRGAQFLIIDDPLKPDDALSDTQRKACNGSITPCTAALTTRKMDASLL